MQVPVHIPNQAQSCKHANGEEYPDQSSEKRYPSTIGQQLGEEASVVCGRGCRDIGRRHWMNLCSLYGAHQVIQVSRRQQRRVGTATSVTYILQRRSEERRVGKECISRREVYQC